MRIRYLLSFALLALTTGPALAEHQKARTAQDTRETPDMWSPIVRVQATVVPSALKTASSLALAHGQAIVWEKAREACSVTKTYNVADLVIPIPPAIPAGVAQASTPPKTLEKELIRSIEQSVVPAQWVANGGQASIDYFATNYSLVVRAAHDVHTKLTAFLNQLRKKLDTQVVLEIQVLTLSDGLFKELEMADAFALSDRPNRKAKIKYITGEQMKHFLELAQKDQQTVVLSAPKMTVLDGQEASLQTLDSQVFTTGLNITNKNDHLIYEPKNEVIETGLFAKLCPQLDMDETTVRLATHLTVRQLEQTPVPMTGVTSMIRPVDGKGPLVPFTQYIQQPKLITREVKDTADIPLGRTAMMYAGQATWKNATKGTPMLAKVPVVAALFSPTHTDHVVVLVTPKVVKPEGDSEEAEAVPTKTDRLTELLKAYHAACRAGKIDDARRLAIECLTIDPACFQK